VAAAIAALDVIEQEPEYAALPLAKAKSFARSAQLPEPESPIVPVLLGEAEAALAGSQLLEENGFLALAYDGATGHIAAAFHLHRATSRRGNQSACRADAQPRARALRCSRNPRAMRAAFITGTGTDIGKTFLATALIRHLRSAGTKVHAIKPIVTGFDENRWQNTDPAALLAALGHPLSLRRSQNIALAICGTAGT
jgi:hypothetical protein